MRFSNMSRHVIMLKDLSRLVLMNTWQNKLKMSQIWANGRRSFLDKAIPWTASTSERSKTKLILTHMPDESTVCCMLVLNGSGTYFSKEKHWPPRTWSFKFLSFGDKQGSTNRKKSSKSFSATSAVSKDTKDKVNPYALFQSLILDTLEGTEFDNNIIDF